MSRSQKQIDDEQASMLTVFLNSKANGAQYDGDKLPMAKWDWPNSTWMKRRLAQIRGEDGET